MLLLLLLLHPTYTHWWKRNSTTCNVYAYDMQFNCSSTLTNATVWSWLPSFSYIGNFQPFDCYGCTATVPTLVPISWFCFRYRYDIIHEILFVYLTVPLLLLLLRFIRNIFECHGDIFVPFIFLCDVTKIKALYTCVSLFPLFCINIIQSGCYQFTLAHLQTYTAYIHTDKYRHNNHRSRSHHTRSHITRKHKYTHSIQYQYAELTYGHDEIYLMNSFDWKTFFSSLFLE